MTDGLTVQLREYVEVAIQHERDLRVAAFHARDEGLRLQAREYERRLDHLNGNLERTLHDRNIFYTKEAQEVFLREYNAFRDQARQELTTIRTWGAAGLIALGGLELALRLYFK